MGMNHKTHPWDGGCIETLSKGADTISGFPDWIYSCN